MRSPPNHRLPPPHRESALLTGSRVPDFFVVGQPKSGTTALYEMLRQHPRIFLPELKEPMFLARDMPLRQPALVRGLPESLDEYLQLFGTAGPDQIAGDASTLYLLSTVAASEIASLNRKAKVVAIFREPTAFLRSFHLESIRAHNEDVKDLRHAMSLEDERRTGMALPKGCLRPELLFYSRHVCYTEQLARFHRVLPAEQIMVIIYDDFLADNLGTVKKVLGFLGVKSHMDVVEVRANATRAVRSPSVANWAQRLWTGANPVGHVLRSTATAVVPSRIRRAVIGRLMDVVVFGDAPPPDAELMAELRARFRGEIEQFGQYIGRDLVAQWGY